MRLREWKDAQGNKVSAASQTNNSAGSNIGNTSSIGSFKKRLNKLINYYGQHHAASVDFIIVNLLTNDTLDFTEYYDDRSALRYNIYIGPATEAWRLKTYKNINGNFQVVDDIAGQLWGELLKTLRAYINIPVVSTPEYADLFTESLDEWLDSKGNKVSLNNSSAPTSKLSKTNKEKFKELTDYMKANANRVVDKAEVVRLDDGGFTYKEHRVSAATNSEFTLTVLVGYSRFNSQWRSEIYMDTTLVEEKSGNGFNELLRCLDNYFNTPLIGSIEYKDLCESASFADDFKTYENLWD